MSDQFCKSIEFDFNGKKLTAVELTGLQVDEWQESIAESEEPPHKRDLLMNKSLPVSVLKISVPALTEDDLDAAPSELEKVYDAVEEVNPFLLEMSARMAKLGEAMFALKGAEKQA